MQGYHVKFPGWFGRGRSCKAVPSHAHFGSNICVLYVELLLLVVEDSKEVADSQRWEDETWCRQSR